MSKKLDDSIKAAKVKLTKLKNEKRILVRDKVFYPAQVAAFGRRLRKGDVLVLKNPCNLKLFNEAIVVKPAEYSEFGFWQVLTNQPVYLSKIYFKHWKLK